MTTTLHNRLGKKTSRRARYTVPVVVCALAMIVALQIVHAKDALLSELQKGQATEGLSIVSTNTDSAGVFFFGDNKFHETRILPSGVVGRDVRLSEDGEQVAFGLFEQPSDLHMPTLLAVATSDGANLRKFPTMQQPTTICWSPGKDRLALWASKTDSGDGAKASGLWTLRLDTGESTLIDTHGSAYCPAWSPDGAKLVYSANGTVSIYDTNTRNSRRLAEADYATWSPDGKWVAVSKGKAYWLLDSQSGAGKVLFKQKNAFTPLWWSPDSQYVAYATRVGVSLSVVEQADLWVRRIHDGAEEKVLRFPWKGPLPDFQWVRSSPLFARARSGG